MDDFFFYGSNWNLAVRPCGLLVGIRPVAQLADSWWNTMDPTQTLPLLPWRERDSVFVCVFICVYVCEEHRDGEEAGGCSPAPKRFVSAKRFSCPSQMAGHAPPLVAEEEEQKEHRHLCVCLTNKLCCDLCMDWICYIWNGIYTLSQAKNTSWKISNAGSGEKSYWGKQNPMTPLKELAFSSPWGEYDRLRETGKGSWTESEDNVGGRWRGMGFLQTAWGLFQSSIWCCGCLKINFARTKRKAKCSLASIKAFCFPPIFHSPFRNRRVCIEVLKHGSLAQFQWCVIYWGEQWLIGVKSSECARAGYKQFHVHLTSLSPTWNLFQRCPQPPQMELSLQRRCCTVLSV